VSSDFLLFSMGEGINRMRVEADEEIVRVTLQYGKEPHNWYYLDEPEVKALHEFLGEWLELPPSAPESPDV